MKIGIFEKEHFEGAYPVIRLFDMPGNQITIYTSQETKQRFDDLFKEDRSRYNWTVVDTSNKLRFFSSLFKKIKKDNPDILYINTISDNHLLYAMVLWLLPVKRVILTVHDINCLFESRFSWNFRKAVVHFGKKWLIRQVDEFNIVADSMREYLKTKAGKKEIHNIPGAVYEDRYLAQNKDRLLRLVVPGSLDKKRRDYEQVFELAELAEKGKLELEIILLGGNTDDYGRGIIQRAKQMQLVHCKLLVYDTTVVDQDEFDRQMDKAHFIFIPSVIHTKICGDIPEIYGITKSSGNLFDIVKHAKPFIVPDRLIVEDLLTKSCFKYSNLSEIIIFLQATITEQSAYTVLQQKALAASQSYTIQKTRERNSTVFMIS